MKARDQACLRTTTAESVPSSKVEAHVGLEVSAQQRVLRKRRRQSATRSSSEKANSDQSDGTLFTVSDEANIRESSSNTGNQDLSVAALKTQRHPPSSSAINTTALRIRNHGVNTLLDAATILRQKSAQTAESAAKPVDRLLPGSQCC